MCFGVSNCFALCPFDWLVWYSALCIDFCVFISVCLLVLLILACVRGLFALLDLRLVLCLFIDVKL